MISSMANAYTCGPIRTASGKGGGQELCGPPLSQKHLPSTESRDVLQNPCLGYVI